MYMDIESYAELIILNIDILQQAIFMGILIAGSCALTGFMILAVVKIFTTVARG
jgi:hypothetical protein